MSEQQQDLAPAWQATVAWTATGGTDTREDALGEVILDALEGQGATGAAISAPDAAGIWAATYTVRATILPRASALAMTVARAALGNAGLVRVDLRWMEVLDDAEATRRVQEPLVPALVSLSDIAARLTVSHTRAAQLVGEHPTVFTEVARTGAGPLFLASRLEEFAGRERRPGRPRKVVES